MMNSSQTPQPRFPGPPGPRPLAEITNSQGTTSNEPNSSAGSKLNPMYNKLRNAQGMSTMRPTPPSSNLYNNYSENSSSEEDSQQDDVEAFFHSLSQASTSSSLKYSASEGSELNDSKSGITLSTVTPFLQSKPSSADDTPVVRNTRLPFVSLDNGGRSMQSSMAPRNDEVVDWMVPRPKQNNPSPISLPSMLAKTPQSEFSEIDSSDFLNTGFLFPEEVSDFHPQSVREEESHILSNGVSKRVLKVPTNASMLLTTNGLSDPELWLQNQQSMNSNTIDGREAYQHDEVTPRGLLPFDKLEAEESPNSKIAHLKKDGIYSPLGALPLEQLGFLKDFYWPTQRTLTPHDEDMFELSDDPKTNNQFGFFRKSSSYLPKHVELESDDGGESKENMSFYRPCCTRRRAIALAAFVMLVIITGTTTLFSIAKVPQNVSMHAGDDQQDVIVDNIPNITNVLDPTPAPAVLMNSSTTSPTMVPTSLLTIATPNSTDVLDPIPAPTAQVNSSTTSPTMVPTPHPTIATPAPTDQVISTTTSPTMVPTSHPTIATPAPTDQVNSSTSLSPTMVPTSHLTIATPNSTDVLDPIPAPTDQVNSSTTSPTLVPTPHPTTVLLPTPNSPAPVVVIRPTSPGGAPIARPSNNMRPTDSPTQIKS